LHILIAEDESLIRMGLKQILEEAGHTVWAAEDGQAALELCEQRTPDVAVLDIKMPRMDGLEAAQRLYERAPLPIIFLTAFGEKDLVERATRLPVMGYLMKPLNEAELLATINVAVRRFAETAKITQAAKDADAQLKDKRTLDRAKGLLMLKHGVSELEASGRLEERARRERRTLLEAAEEIIEELTTTAPPPVSR
jgi:response regulator NasT